MSMICPKCGCVIKDGNVFCTNCGERVNNVSTTNQRRKNHVGVASNQEILLSDNPRKKSDNPRKKKKDPLEVNKSIVLVTRVMLIAINLTLVLAALYSITCATFTIIGRPLIELEGDLPHILGILSIIFSSIAIILCVLSLVLKKHYKLVILFTLLTFVLVITGGHFLYYPLSIFSGIIMTYVFLFFAIPVFIVYGRANSFIKRAYKAGLDKIIGKQNTSRS